MQRILFAATVKTMQADNKRNVVKPMATWRKELKSDGRCVMVSGDEE